MKITRTRRILQSAKRLVGRGKAVPKRGQGFVCAWIRQRWCGGWYDTYWSVITVASGTAKSSVRRLEGLPARFAALLLLYKLAAQQPNEIACRVGT